MYCAHCNETYSLPQGGTVKLYKEIKCPLDEFELLMFSSPAKVSGLGCLLHAMFLSVHVRPCVHTHIHTCLFTHTVVPGVPILL